MAEEELPRCPLNKRWLLGMYKVLGREIFMESKLARFYPCIEEEVKKLEKRE